MLHNAVIKFKPHFLRRLTAMQNIDINFSASDFNDVLELVSEVKAERTPIVALYRSMVYVLTGGHQYRSDATNKSIFTLRDEFVAMVERLTAEEQLIEAYAESRRQVLQTLDSLKPTRIPHVQPAHATQRNLSFEASLDSALALFRMRLMEPLHLGTIAERLDKWIEHYMTRPVLVTAIRPDGSQCQDNYNWIQTDDGGYPMWEKVVLEAAVSHGRFTVTIPESVRSTVQEYLGLPDVIGGRRRAPRSRRNSLDSSGSESRNQRPQQVNAFERAFNQLLEEGDTSVDGSGDEDNLIANDRMDVRDEQRNEQEAV